MWRFLALTVLLLAIVSAEGALVRADPNPASPNLIGTWLTQDQGGVIAISPCDGDLCARIVGVMLDHPNDPMPVDYRGMSQCNLALIADAQQVEPNLWKGHILDPRNGGIYGVELHLDPDGNLALRGFLGIPLLGHTQTWTRYTGTLPDDCRIAPGNTQAGPSVGLPSRSAKAR